MKAYGIKHIRIDERLIHGQVATMWVNTVKASRIMIVDNAVVKSDLEKMALKTAVPAGMKLSILTVEGAAKNILNGKYQDQRVFLIVKSPSALVGLVKNGVEIDSVNVGNMSAKQGSKQIRKSIGVTEKDVEDFLFLKNNGVKLNAQMVPSDDIVDFSKLIEI
ncbi:PTS system mannose/fructose/N-acetylgalactosamine-transporter subunit IIB [Bacillus chungangensis]|uniref:PTS system mannose-specific IIB component n=1 Tax=Bacillus chungangensis TaxID=587633 RepID=A0ABT9WXN8_9BACI|nr:PTS sugar transporter subunit IIB [Bacillus chungangensis]MDQ0177946.1 PTS system mannose-specific IIB component [Bacillus chungangensis]